MEIKRTKSHVMTFLFITDLGHFCDSCLVHYYPTQYQGLGDSSVQQE